ncbi:MAG: PilZ domain-containing protein [Oleibacter sp.]|nr:PilZ domain-containing protein [Thalassolituus sp.]
MDRNDTMLSSIMASEQRQAKRVHLFKRVQVQDNEQSLETFCLDISMRGILLVLPENVQWQLEQALTVTLTLDDAPTDSGNHSDTIVMKVSLVHIDDDVVGCACDAMDIEGQEALRHVLETSLEVPSQMNRELADLITSANDGD